MKIDKFFAELKRCNNHRGLARTSNFDNTTGSDNTGTGVFALFYKSSGRFNTAIGVSALQDNTTGNYNTANGVQALYSNNTGGYNTATGDSALHQNTIGPYNAASCASALYGNTGSSNTASGYLALFSNTTGNNNMASGNKAIFNNTTGSFNMALGNVAGGNLTTGSNNIDIGSTSVAAESRAIRIGTTGTHTSTFIAGISGATVTGTAVVVNGSGQLGVPPSSKRFKQKIQTMGDASDISLALRPVTFKYKPDVDPKGVCQFGLVAEEVEKVNPDRVARDADGKPYTVRYDAVNAMLLNEFLKEHAKVEQLKKDSESKIAKQQKQIQALTAGLEKVSAQLEVSKAAPQTVLNNQ